MLNIYRIYTWIKPLNLDRFPLFTVQYSHWGPMLFDSSILQNIFFCVPQKKESHTGLEPRVSQYIYI